MNNLRLLPVLMIVAVCFIVGGCGKTSEEGDNGVRDSLYHDVCELTKSYTDSLGKANDTVTAEALLAHWENRLQSIYMKYPPASDRLLTEDYNDTIYMLTENMVKAYRQALAPEDSIPADSISTDSIPVVKEVGKK